MILSYHNLPLCCLTYMGPPNMPLISAIFLPNLLIGGCEEMTTKRCATRIEFLPHTLHLKGIQRDRNGMRTINRLGFPVKIWNLAFLSSA